MELFIGGPLLTRTDNRPPVATGDQRRSLALMQLALIARNVLATSNSETDEDG